MSDAAPTTKSNPLQPVVYDLQGWQATLLEHRRRLFERVVASFATELNHKRPAIDAWRSRLSGPSVHGS